MNKQEAIEKIKDLYRFIMEDGPFEVDLINKNQAIDIISQIDEPQKVTVPKFVAEWIEECKSDNKWLMYALCKPNFENHHKVSDWLGLNDGNILIFSRAWFDGYEIEKEKLYTVEIAEAILTKITRGSNIQYKMLPFGNVTDVFDKAMYTTRLTEQEIKQKDERLWQFAKEVE